MAEETITTDSMVLEAFVALESAAKSMRRDTISLSSGILSAGIIDPPPYPWNNHQFDLARDLLALAAGLKIDMGRIQRMASTAESIGNARKIQE